MRKAIILAGSFVVFMATHGASAADATRTYEDCIDKNSTNMAWAVCGDSEIKRQDQRLNTAWKKAIACFEPGTEARTKLLEEQRLWIKWKDASCQFYWDNMEFGREGAVLHGPSCRAGVLEERAKFLESLADFCARR